jgi:hypothetical protein
MTPPPPSREAAPAGGSFRRLIRNLRRAKEANVKIPPAALPYPGTIGVIHGDKHDWDVTARAEVIWVNTRQIKVKLLEDFYCCEAGEEIRCAARLFTQQEIRSE